MQLIYNIHQLHRLLTDLKFKLFFIITSNNCFIIMIGENPIQMIKITKTFNCITMRFKHAIQYFLSNM